MQPNLTYRPYSCGTSSQSALSKYGKIVIDNEKQMITITGNTKKK